VYARGRRVGKTSAQVLLRWGVQLGMTMLTRSSSEARLKQASEIFDFALSEDDMALISGLAWFAAGPTNRVPPSVVDTYGVAAADAAAFEHVPRDRAPVAKPIKACDMAWNMIGDRKVEL
jgi:hypothetical protein